jgi:hypothetical protein
MVFDYICSLNLHMIQNNFKNIFYQVLIGLLFVTAGFNVNILDGPTQRMRLYSDGRTRGSVSLFV